MSCLIACRLVKKIERINIYFVHFKFIIVKENKKPLNCRDNISKESTKVPLCGVYLVVKYNWKPDPMLSGKCTP